MANECWALYTRLIEINLVHKANYQGVWVGGSPKIQTKLGNFKTKIKYHLFCTKIIHCKLVPVVFFTLHDSKFSSGKNNDYKKVPIDINLI